MRCSLSFAAGAGAPCGRSGGRTGRARLRLAWTAAAILAGCWLSFSSAAWGLDDYWTNTSDGTFSVGANWGQGIPPGAQDRAVFNLPNSHRVDFTADATTAGLSALQGQVTLNLQGHNYTLAGNVNVANFTNTGTSLDILGNYQ